VTYASLQKLISAMMLSFEMLDETTTDKEQTAAENGTTGFV